MANDKDPKPPMDTIAKLRHGIQVSNDEFPMEATPKERRRYAILQCAGMMIAGHWPYVSKADLIRDAKALLDEIERQEDEHA